MTTERRSQSRAYDWVIMKRSINFTAQLTLIVLFAVAAIFIGCGSNDETPPENATGNAVDAMFVTGMIPHHQGAIDMAELAEEESNRAEIKELSAAILESQQAEIETMRELKTELPQNAGTMMSEEQMTAMHDETDQLTNADDFDKAFIEAMVPHHEGAVTMARRLQIGGKNEQLQEMSKAIIAAQMAEIESMRAWYEDWYGEPLPVSEDGGHGMH